MILIGEKEARPISFVDDLIKRILADEKDKTRRIIRGVPYWIHINRPIMNWGLSGCYLDDDGRAWLDIQTDVDDNSHQELRCPYGKPGDLLWVRERFVALELVSDAYPFLRASSINEASCVMFSDGLFQWNRERVNENKWGPSLSDHIVWRDRINDGDKLKFRPPMHLPFWAHRTNLEVTSIEIERVQDITEADAVREGFKADEPGLDKSDRVFDKIVCPQCGGTGLYVGYGMGGATFDCDCELCVSARGKFRIKWDQINGRRIDKFSDAPMTWETNPFVWSVGFKRVSDPK